MKGRQCAAFAAVIALLLGSVAIVSGAPANPVNACPFAITAAGTYTLTNNLTAAGDCITITQPLGDSVTINLNGFTITGDGSGAAIVAPNPGKKISVVGQGTITNFLYGVQLDQTSDVTVKRLNVNNTFVGIVIGQGSVYDSTASDNFLGVGAGDKSTITNVTANNNPNFGIVVGAGSSVEQSTANNNGAGIIVSGDKSLVKNSTANGNDFGIFVEGVSATVTQCTANGNGSAGIAADGTQSNINHNTANNNATGISVPCPATVQQNTATDNTVDIDLNGTGCTVKKNTTTP